MFDLFVYNMNFRLLHYIIISIPACPIASGGFKGGPEGAQAHPVIGPLLVTW